MGTFAITAEGTVHRWRDLGNYQLDSWNGITARLKLAPGHGYDASSEAFTVEFRTSGTQSILDGQGNTIFTDGEVTRVIYRDSSGAKIADFTGLHVDWGQIWWQLNNGQNWNIDDLIFAGGHTFNGFGGQHFDTSYNVISSGPGDDIVMSGDSDFDLIKDRGGADHYDGGAGLHDELLYDEVLWNPTYGKITGIVADLAAGTVVGPDGFTDTVTNIERIRGTFLADTMLGDGQDNRFTGLRGRDIFDGRGGVDEVRYDRDSGQGGTLGIIARLNKGTVRDGFGNVDTLTSIEAIRATETDDRIWDSRKDNLIDARGGDDFIVLTRGDDRILGGGGNDTFVFKGKRFGDNRIDDFQAGQDVIEILRAKNFGQLTLTDEAGGVLVTHAQGTIFLDGLSVAQLDAADFGF